MFKQLPTMISELNKLGIALKALDGMNLATVGINTGNLDTFRSAIEGLSTEQAVFALASKGATEEQIRQILITKQSEAADVEAALAKAGLTTATSALTQAEMVELATKTGVTKADAEALLSKIGITAAEEGQVAVKHQVTMAMLEQAIANGTLTSAESAQIATMLGLNAAETANIGITNILTGAIAKLWAVITAHPIGAILTAVGAVAVGVIAYINKSNKDAQKAIVETHEKAQQALDDTKTALSDDKSELESVNSELDSTKQKIQDIASQGTITLTEQNELDKLSTANTQLETQKSLLENNIKLKQKSAALDAKNLLDTQVEMDYSDIQDGKDIVSHKESYSYAEHAEYEANSLKNAYNIYMSALRNGDAEKQKIAQELIDAASGDTAELTSSLLEIVESFKYDDGTIIEGYEDLYNQYMGLIYNLQSLTNPEMFLDIAKQATEGTNIDYEKAISDGYAMAYDGEFDIDKLNQDFVKALADNGIDESTIEYIFKLKQQEYQNVVDNINKKYNPDNVIKPTYLTEAGHVDTKEETQKQSDSQNYEQQKQEVQNINDELTEYAKEHPIEFQLITSYDENFSTLDKYIEEEKSKSESAIQDTKSQLEDLSKNGNVDLTIRPVIDSSAMQAAGWDVEDGSIATTFTQGEFIWQGDEENGQYVYVHYTPITPDGKVMTPEEMSDYLYNQLEGAQNILDADDKGLVLKVDTDLQGISEDDIKALQEDGKQSTKMSNFLNQMGQWDDSLHDVQEGYYLTGDSVDYVDNAVNRLVEDAKKAKGEIPNETATPSFSTLFDGSDFGDRISYLNQQFQNGKISAHDYFQSIRDELANTDFSEFTDQAAAAQQFFTDSTQQVASSMSDLINSYNNGEISATEYLDGYTSMAETLSALTDDLQNNSAAWNENGEAISDGTNQALDNAQSDLASAIEGINQYQDSIYSLEQITSGAITAGSDEFTAHAQVIAEDLAYIVQNGGYMADQIANTMGTTTSEIANSLTNSVDNQALASQAIAGNTNASIEQMANAVSTLFAELGNQIGNFKATVNFAPKVNGVEHFSAIKIGGKEVVGGDIPNLTYDIKGSSSSLKSIGSAISSFGKVLSSNISAQKVDYKKFSTTPTDSSGKERSYTPSKGVTNNYNNKLKNNKSSGKSGSGSGSGSGSDAEKQNEEYLDKFMTYQKARLEAGKITYQQYSQYVSDELERMYKNGEISASKYYSAVKDMIDEQKSIYDAALKGVTKLLDDEVQKWQDKIDAIEKTNDKLNEQKDKYDSILSAIQKVYDDEIEDANKRKDSIQDVIDAMSDENDEYERQKKLQEAIYNLNKANSQKTKYLLKDGQFVYSTDNSAIRDAQDSLHDAQYDVDVANLKKQQDDIDNYIDTLNEFKDKWSEISDAFSEAQDTMNLKQYLGSEYQRIILSNNLADIENFKNQYVAVESQINSNEQLKTSYEEKVDYYNNLKQQWEDCTSKYDDEMNKLYASQVLGANWETEVLSGRLQTLTNFTSEYEKLCQRRADAAVNAANVEVQASKNAAAGVTSTSSSVASSGGGSSSGGNSSSTSSTPKVTYDKNNNPNKPAQKSKDYWTYEKLSSGYSTSGQASSHISNYASKGANGFTQIGNKYFVVKWIANAGTPANASKAKNKLEKDNPKKIGKYGYAKRYHKGLELGKIEGLPKDKAFDLVQDVGINGLKSDEVPIIAQKREAVITEEQIENLAKTLHLVPVQNEIMEKMSKINLGDLPMNTPKMNFDASKVGQSVTRNNFAPNVTLNLNCPNVSSVSDAKAITDVVDKQLNKFANDFYQASLHYVNKK